MRSSKFMILSYLERYMLFNVSRVNTYLSLVLCSVMGLLPLVCIIIMLFFFDASFNSYQPFMWLINNKFYLIGLDGISFLFILLVLFIFPICFFALNFYSVMERRFLFFLYLIVLEVFLLSVFLLINLLSFYIFFEATLIPMFLLIGSFGSRFRKYKAAYYLFFYTFLGSVFMLIGLFIIYSLVGSLSFFTLFNFEYSVHLQRILWCLFFITFAVKIPMLPFHLWLPEAHVEAPTIGSIILASILLKLGGYGFLRFLVFLFHDASVYFSPIVIVLAVSGILFASLSTLRQIDIKRIIAYSSIAHMNMAVLGLFVCNIYGIFGAIYLMFGHGLISTGLFFAIGVLYDRYHTRLLFYYGGLAVVMPLYTGILLFLLFANIGFPGTFNFISEVNILLGVWVYNGSLLYIILLGFVLTVVYSIWFFNRIMFGTLKTIYCTKFSDLNGFELSVFGFLLFFVLLFGLSTEFSFYFIDFFLI